MSSWSTNIPCPECGDLPVKNNNVCIKCGFEWSGEKVEELIPKKLLIPFASFLEEIGEDLSSTDGAKISCGGCLSALIVGIFIAIFLGGTAQTFAMVCFWLIFIGGGLAAIYCGNRYGYAIEAKKYEQVVKYKIRNFQKKNDINSLKFIIALGLLAVDSSDCRYLLHKLVRCDPEFKGMRETLELMISKNKH